MASANGMLVMCIIGNLGADPEMRYTASGQAVTNFRMAVNQRVLISEGVWEPRAQWFKVTVWGKQAEACNQYLKSGSKVGVDVGRFTFDLDNGSPKLFTRGDGSTGANYEVTADTVRFLDPRPEGAGETAGDDIVF